ASISLQRLLPLLTSGHYGQLGPQTVPDLCRSLEYYANSAPFCLAILDALIKVGDGRAIKTVQKIADETPFSTVRAAAQNLLPILYERQRQEAEPQMLLRATQAPQTPSEQLLRPSQEKQEADAEVLLRASGQ